MGMGSKWRFLASEKALNTICVWVSRLSCNVSCLASSAPSVCLGLCGEQQVFPMLGKVYSHSKALVPALPHRSLGFLAFLCTMQGNTLLCARDFPIT